MIRFIKLPNHQNLNLWNTSPLLYSLLFDPVLQESNLIIDLHMQRTSLHERRARKKPNFKLPLRSRIRKRQIHLQYTEVPRWWRPWKILQGDENGYGRNVTQATWTIGSDEEYPIVKYNLKLDPLNHFTLLDIIIMLSICYNGYIFRESESLQLQGQWGRKRHAK